MCGDKPLDGVAREFLFRAFLEFNVFLGVARSICCLDLDFSMR